MTLKKMMTVLVITLGGSLTGCGGGNGGNNDNVATVSGTIVDGSGTPINNAQVTISSTPVTVSTDANGQFSVKVDRGNHTIVVKVGTSTVYNSTFTCNDATCNLGSVAAEHCAFSGWRKHVANPVFFSGVTGAWDDPLMGGASVWRRDEHWLCDVSGRY